MTFKHDDQYNWLWQSIMIIDIFDYDNIINYDNQYDDQYNWLWQSMMVINIFDYHDNQ
jgi:hypothetical protein